ncbi:cytochrome c [Noviherbaspirillum sp.]|uniref:c-type cytochrome n=1 Tax=Noviherbaspirillum sp. TaxID=1926288 RepID=UPI002D6B7E91|nr:cytochrome c [Noviherbaspirillum sp.]HZW20953.1 cytochrome c [Noviherbaspirillum sp.]
MTRNRIALLLAAAAVIIVGGIVFFSQPSVPYIDPSDQQAVARGKDIYTAQCAVCHGAKLEGQPEWRKRLPNGRLPAPPHDESGHTWHHPDAVLVDIVKHGLVPGRTAPDGYQSDMPAYAQTLSDADISAVLAYIKSTWPAEVRAQQKEMTLNQSRR